MLLPWLNPQDRFGKITTRNQNVQKIGGFQVTGSKAKFQPDADSLRVFRQYSSSNRWRCRLSIDYGTCLRLGRWEENPPKRAGDIVSGDHTSDTWRKALRPSPSSIHRIGVSKQWCVLSALGWLIDPTATAVSTNPSFS